MPFRFRKRVKIAPGLHLNLSKRGVGVGSKVGPVSGSVGADRRKRVGVSIPGTGIGYYKTIGAGSRANAGRSSAGAFSNENMARGAGCITWWVTLPFRLLWWPIAMVIRAVAWTFARRERAIIAAGVLLAGLGLMALQYAALAIRGGFAP